MNDKKISSSIVKILLRDLAKVENEINLFQQEENLWILEGTINNTAGNLALHIAGAINHFIGAVVGNNGYIRDREKEFNDKGVPKGDIIMKLRCANETVLTVLPNLSDDDMEKEFPEKIGGKTLTNGFFLIHLVTHINYHLGQINYHRRILDK